MGLAPRWLRLLNQFLLSLLQTQLAIFKSRFLNICKKNYRCSTTDTDQRDIVYLSLHLIRNTQKL